MCEVDFGLGRAVEPGLAHAADDADDFTADRYAVHRPAELDAFTDRLFALEVLRRRGFAEQYDRHSAGTIALVEQTSTLQRNAHRLDVTGCHNAHAQRF